ncbi:MAG: hypothetical protein P1V35_06570 [Planctomycetota bacterium]|nr:hypothetical protein [Planctomycetota bacterium]
MTESKFNLTRVLLCVAFCSLVLLVFRELGQDSGDGRLPDRITESSGEGRGDPPAQAGGAGAATAMQAPRVSERQTATAGASAAASGQASARPAFVPLAGRVLLADGTPAGWVGLSATWVRALPPLPGSTPVEPDPATIEKPKSIKADASGSFSFAAVRPGIYKLEAYLNGDLPVLGTNEFSTDQGTHNVLVDAIFLQAIALDPSDQVVPIAGISYSVLTRKGTNMGSSVSMSWQSPRSAYSTLVSTTERIWFRATGEAGDSFYGILEPGSPSGTQSLYLLEYPPSLGSLRLTLHEPNLPDGAFIRVDSMQRDGEEVSLLEPTVKAKNGRVELPLGGLLPGHYKLQLALQNAGPVALQEEHYDRWVRAGDHPTLVVEAFTGGLIQIKATAETPAQGRLFATAEYRYKGDQDWQLLWLTTHTTGGGMLFNTSVLVANSAAQSLPLPPGDYELRLSLEGHHPETRYIQLNANSTEELEIHLSAQ